MPTLRSRFCPMRECNGNTKLACIEELVCVVNLVCFSPSKHLVCLGMLYQGLGISKYRRNGLVNVKPDQISISRILVLCLGMQALEHVSKENKDHQQPPWIQNNKDLAAPKILSALTPPRSNTDLIRCLQSYSWPSLCHLIYDLGSCCQHLWQVWSTRRHS